MNKIFEISTREYEPISIGSSYLFEQSNAIISFLKHSLDTKYINSIATPKLVEKSEMIEWYANSSGSVSLIDSFETEDQLSIKQKYWDLKFKINEIIQSLRGSSKSAEANQWIEILTSTFSEDNNLLLSNGEDLFLIWGWKFNAGAINYLDPQFFPSSLLKAQSISDKESENVSEELPSIDTDSKIESAISENTENEKARLESELGKRNLNVILSMAANSDTPESVTELNTRDSVGDKVFVPIRRLTFWERIKRFFRWISYRFWALMLLIIFILLLCCLCKNCSNKKAAPCDNCKELDSINKRLEETKIRLKENCPPK